MGLRHVFVHTPKVSFRKLMALVMSQVRNFHTKIRLPQIHMLAHDIEKVIFIFKTMIQLILAAIKKIVIHSF